MHSKLTETFSKYEKIILVGGGTGGHIQPIINLSEELTDKNLVWIGGKDSSEEKEARKTNIVFESISTLKLSTTLSPKVILYPYFLIKGIIEVRSLLKANIGTCVFSKGGPGSVAIGIAAWTLGIDLYIHESDTIPGRSNRILGKFAKRIFLGFESAKQYFKKGKCETIGQILHPVFQGSMKNKEGKIQWKTTKPHILVICGSQGSRAIYDALLGQLSGNHDYEWIISLGKLNGHMKSGFEKVGNTQALEWISQEDIAHLLSSTDLAITRGSATTLAEIDTFGVRKIIIPLPHSAGDHQYWNAREYEKKGDILLEQKNIYQLKEILEKYV